MKIRIFILVLALLSIIFLSLFSKKNPYYYKDNVLYSQRDVHGYKEKESESSNLVNRNEAIKIAKYYIEDILGNDVDRDNSKMYVNLYKNDENAESYFWNISWFRDDLSCGVEINTINKQINSIYVNRYPNKSANSSDIKYSLLTKDEILEIVEELTYPLKIDLSLYNLNISDMNYNNEHYKVCTFINKNNKEDKFEISICTNGNYIARYSINPSKEIFK